jgi:TM2 domain-containing membrane protein YozV
MPPALTDNAVASDAPNLKDPVVAGCLAWLVPGLGHLYQGRWAKGILFLLCITGTFCYGLWLGGGRVVYVSMKANDRRLAYLCQIGVGLPSLPALVQAQRFRSKSVREQAQQRERAGQARLFDWFMVPPTVSDDPHSDDPDELDELHRRLHRFFELGTVYTMIAGLLNVLAIYDACGGPAYTDEELNEQHDEQEAEAK